MCSPDNTYCAVTVRPGDTILWETVWKISLLIMFCWTWLLIPKTIKMRGCRVSLLTGSLALVSGRVRCSLSAGRMERYSGIGLPAIHNLFFKCTENMASCVLRFNARDKRFSLMYWKTRICFNTYVLQ